MSRVALAKLRLSVPAAEFTQTSVEAAPILNFFDQLIARKRADDNQDAQCKLDWRQNIGQFQARRRC
jgi:hypothetical protein